MEKNKKKIGVFLSEVQRTKLSGSSHPRWKFLDFIMHKKMLPRKHELPLFSINLINTSLVKAEENIFLFVIE